MDKKEVEVQPSNTFTISTGNHTFSVTRGKLLGWLLAIVLMVAVGAVSYNEFGTRPTVETLAYYQFKSVQYQGVIQNLISQFANINPRTHNDLVRVMNTIGQTAGTVGTPVETDRNAGLIYLLDSSIITKVKTIEEEKLETKEEVTNENN